jgi:sulfate-transporting ATPase
MLLDEPTNHLDAETVAWLQHHLADFAGTVVLVTHDRYFLDQITGWILELDRGQGLPYEGNYSNWLEQNKNASSKKRARMMPKAHAGPRAGLDSPIAQSAAKQKQGAD